MCHFKEVEASKKIGLWRQKVNETKVLVHSQYLVDVVQRRGIDVEGLVNQKDCGGLPQSVLKEVQR